MTVPHCTLEYSANLTDFAAGRMLAALNAELLASGLFAEADIKSCAIRLEQFAVGVVPAPRASVHLTLSVLSGRSADERAALARQALAARPRVTASTLAAEYPDDFARVIGLHTYSQSPRRDYDITLTGEWVERGGFRFEEFVLTPRREDGNDGRTE